jgi:lipopolysaccharide transport system ATP-binding protein
MSDVVLKVENLYKRYRLGNVDRSAFKEDLVSGWAKLLGRPDPYEKYVTSNQLSAVKNKEELEQLGARYVWALQDINFEVKRGEILGVIGKNGAGKSTLLKILSKTTAPTKGQVKIKGRIASLLEVGTGFHGDLTGRENIFLNGSILGMNRHEIRRKLDEITDFAGVEAFLDTPVKRYSSGMYVRLAFAVAAHLDPDILIVDEVLAVGDAEFQKKCIGKMKSVSTDEGRTVLFVSHNMAVIQKLCTKGVLIKNGHLELSGPIEQCVKQYAQSQSTEARLRQIAKIDDSFRIYHDYQKRIVDFVSVEFADKREGNRFASDEPLSFIITIIGTKSVENLRIALGIESTNENPVGLLFSPQILSTEAGIESKVILTINDHFLAKGEYSINLSIGIGDHTDSGITDYDTILKVLSFEIAYHNTSKQDLINLWNQDWGHINFQNIEVQQFIEQ